ncbi:VanZ family protein [Pediococcus ethanolidurans]|uniref:VanZ family protein n=1 Tax=Pediococcus ethanolidurans TaxID=319653 RepID=UPI0037CBECAA
MRDDLFIIRSLKSCLRNQLTSITTGILIGFTIEFIQFITDNLAITHRWVDINDVLANTLGFVIGYYLSKLIDK